MTKPDARPRVRLPAQLRHDLLTPVNAILGYSEMLLEDTEDNPPGQARELENIRSAAQVLAALLGASTGDSSPDGEVRLAAPDTRNPRESSTQFHSETHHPTSLGSHAGRQSPRVGMGSFLVADDNEMNREVLQWQLQRQGYTVTEASTGREALELIQTQAFDLLLLDIMMPEMDGYELLKILKSDPILREIPVIMISALDNLDSIVRCIELGAEDYLPKPFDPVLLKARISASLEKKRHRDQELDYLKGVAQLTSAASAVEVGAFDPDGLSDTSSRSDELGKLARVFLSMAREVRSRELRLKQAMQDLRIEIDESRKAGQVAEITETEYFRSLQEKARKLRANRSD